MHTTQFPLSTFDTVKLCLLLMRFAVRVRSAGQKIRANVPPKGPTLRAQDWSRLRIQSLLYRSQGPLGKDYFRTTIFFSRQLCNLACRYLIGMVITISRRECIHQTTLNCNITPNISSILQRLFHGERTEAARQHAKRPCWRHRVCHLGAIVVAWAARWRLGVGRI